MPKKQTDPRFDTDKGARSITTLELFTCSAMQGITSNCYNSLVQSLGAEAAAVAIASSATAIAKRTLQYLANDNI